MRKIERGLALCHTPAVVPTIALVAARSLRTYSNEFRPLWMAILFLPRDMRSELCCLSGLVLAIHSCYVCAEHSSVSIVVCDSFNRTRCVHVEHSASKQPWIGFVSNCAARLGVPSSGARVIDFEVEIRVRVSGSGSRFIILVV